MQNNLISVIIPIYNVEKYIKQCLDSVINQTYKNLEIICVDDCGMDNSMQIVEGYAKNDNRIKIIKLPENSGQGKARNVGIDHATGDYILFIDNDDFIDNDYIEKLVNAAKRTNVDVVCNPAILKYFGDDNSKNKFIKSKREYDLNEVLDWNDELLKTLPISACCKLYKTSLLKDNKIYFAENRLKFEDFYFWYILKTKIRNIYIIFDSVYYYRQRENSIMSVNKYQQNDCFDSLYIIKLIYEYYKNNNLLDKHQIPFSWLNKYFKKINNKEQFFNLIKEFFQTIKLDIITNGNIYKFKYKMFFNLILNSKSYKSFKIKYFFVKLLG